MSPASSPPACSRFSGPARAQRVFVLSLRRCRALLPASEAGISDAELDRLRRQLYEVAHMVLDIVVGDHPPASPVASHLTPLDSDSAEAYHPGGDE